MQAPNNVRWPDDGRCPRLIPCATHKPPHQKARRKSASKRKRVVTASIKACGPRGPSQEGWHDKQAIANKPMGLKWGLLAPTPERGRICMPRKTIDKQTKKPISDKTIHRVFKTFCYDEQEATVGNIAMRLSRIASQSEIIQPGSRLPSMSFTT